MPFFQWQSKPWIKWKIFYDKGLKIVKRMMKENKTLKKLFFFLPLRKHAKVIDMSLSIVGIINLLYRQDIRKKESCLLFAFKTNNLANKNMPNFFILMNAIEKVKRQKTKNEFSTNQTLHKWTRMGSHAIVVLENIKKLFLKFSRQAGGKANIAKCFHLTKKWRYRTVLPNGVRHLY